MKPHEKRNAGPRFDKYELPYYKHRRHLSLNFPDIKVGSFNFNMIDINIRYNQFPGSFLWVHIKDLRASSGDEGFNPIQIHVKM